MELNLSGAVALQFMVLKKMIFRGKTGFSNTALEIRHTPPAVVLPRSVVCPYYSSYGQRNLEYVLPLLPGGMLIDRGQSSKIIY